MVCYNVRGGGVAASRLRLVTTIALQLRYGGL